MIEAITAVLGIVIGAGLASMYYSKKENKVNSRGYVMLRRELFPKRGQYVEKSTYNSKNTYEDYTVLGETSKDDSKNPPKLPDWF